MTTLIMSLSDQSSSPPSDIGKYTPCLHIVLFQPEIPHNTGSVGRTCVAVGAKLWLVRPLGFRMDDYYLRRAGLDYWEHLEVETVDDWSMLESRLLNNVPRPPFLFTKLAKHPYTDVAYQPDDVLVFGRESSGLPDWLHRKYPDTRLMVPTRPQVRSLNLSNTATLVMYEAVRQGVAKL